MVIRGSRRALKGGRVRGEGVECVDGFATSHEGEVAVILQKRSRYIQTLR